MSIFGYEWSEIQAMQQRVYRPMAVCGRLDYPQLSDSEVKVEFLAAEESGCVPQSLKDEIVRRSIIL